jgi:hypothetical protein
VSIYSATTNVYHGENKLHFVRFCKCEDYNEDSEDIKVKYHLVLRQWQDLNPASEFRCYVRNNQLVGKYL